jgi:hypothetical protein
MLIEVGLHPVVDGGEETLMATDFHFSLENRPGTGAQVLNALGQAGVNIIGVAGTGGGSDVHLAVEDGDTDRARQALESINVSVSDQSDVVVVPVEDRPGAGAEILRKISQAGANLEFVYLATNNRVVLGTSDPDAVGQALSS